MKSVLVTGAGRGIGRATALRLAASGWHVHAGVRKIEDGDALVAAADGSSGLITPLQLDITDDDAVAALSAKFAGGLDGLVNNAGIVIDGPVESLTPERLRQQFDVNVIGTVGVTRALLPALRLHRGRVVFVSSVSGRISTPWTGAYNASKFAVEGFADALRLEVRPWKIRVSLIEPANTQTDMWGGAVEMFEAGLAGMTPEERTLYAGHEKGVARTLKMMQKTASPVDGVTADIEKALTARRPRARYVVGVPAKLQVISSAITPRPLLDFTLAKAMGIPRRAK